MHVSLFHHCTKCGWLQPMAFLASCGRPGRSYSTNNFKRKGAETNDISPKEQRRMASPHTAIKQLSVSS